MTATIGEQVDPSRWRKQGEGQGRGRREERDPEVEAGVGHHARLGIGLPMSNIFAKCVFHYSFFLERGFGGKWVLICGHIGILEDRWSLFRWMDGVSVFFLSLIVAGADIWYYRHGCVSTVAKIGEYFPFFLV